MRSYHFKDFAKESQPRGRTYDQGKTCLVYDEERLPGLWTSFGITGSTGYSVQHQGLLMFYQR